jgi:hypothetical protein
MRRRDVSNLNRKTAMGINVAAFLANLEAKVAAAVTTADGLKVVQDLAPEFATLALQLNGDFAATARNVYTSVENGAVSAEQHLVLAAKAGYAKLVMDVTNIFHRTPAAPAA